MSDPDHSGLRVDLSQRTPFPLSVAFDCANGEMLGLVGPSGSGKSTVLRMIAGLIRPASGHVSVGNHVLYSADLGVDLPPQRRRVGFVFQDYALFPHLAALENVVVALGHLPRESRPGRARELLGRVNLQGLEGRYPAQLSGGQRQRVALARALAREPEVLLLDEPFSAVDQVTRRKLHRELARLMADLDMPVVMVTHDLEEAAMLADRMCIVYHGTSLQSGVPEEIMHRPGTPLVANAVAARNLFPGRVEAHDQRDGVTWLSWQGLRLETALDLRFPAGSSVVWLIPPADVILHRRDRPSRGERENPVEGQIVEMVRLGSTMSVSIAVGASPYPLSMDVPVHVARRNGLQDGVSVRVSLLGKSIHLMPDPS